MKIHTEYICEICGKKFEKQEKAEACEKSHKLPKKVDKPEFFPEDAKPEYPMSVLIHFSDNSSARYYRKEKK